MSATPLSRALSSLRHFAAKVAPAARCDLCGAGLAESHEHLFEPRPRRVACACTPCALLFRYEGTGRTLRVESRAVPLPGMVLGEQDFRALEIPIRLAFISPSRVHDCVFAAYPSASGAIDSRVSPAAWLALVSAHPPLGDLRPETEGLLIDYLGGRSRAFIASVDVCYRFVGLLRGQGRAHGAAAEAMRFLDGLAGGAHA